MLHKSGTTECLINPTRGRGEAALTGTVVICPNPIEASSLGRIAKEQGWQRHFLYNSALWGRIDGQAAVSGPAVGAPMAVLTLEKLIALGGQRFVVFGPCGALDPGLAVGDVLLPTWSVSQEGTSGHYPLAAPASPSSSLLDKLTELFGRQGIAAHDGGVWTTDAPYRERRDHIAQLQAQGVTAVDMEFSALLTVAAFRQVELAAVLVVSDLLWGPAWHPGFGSKAFKTATKQVGLALFDGLAQGNL